MKRLTLIRHGKSSWDSLSQDDFVRPLNSRGLRDCGRMPALISESIPQPQILLSSDALRARMTSEAIAEGYEVPEDEIEYKPCLYLASIELLKDYLSVQDDAVGHIMLVGHNPGLTDLYNFLCPQTVDDLPTFGVADLQLSIDSWGGLQADCATLEKFLKPKLIG